MTRRQSATQTAQRRAACRWRARGARARGGQLRAQSWWWRRRTRRARRAGRGDTACGLAKTRALA
eukprot:6193790-Prymnesium_polylepis.1